MGNINNKNKKNQDSSEEIKHYAYDSNGVGLPTFNIYITGLPESGKTELLKSICKTTNKKKIKSENMIENEHNNENNKYNVGVRSFHFKMEKKVYPRLWLNLFDPPSVHLNSPNKVPFADVICKQSIETTALMICFDAVEVLNDGVENVFVTNFN